MGDSEKGYKWWIRFVIVPLCTGGIIIALVKIFFPTPASVVEDCPGSLLKGKHTLSGHASWDWELNSETGDALIFKSNSSVTGNVRMSCADNSWSAFLTNMSHDLQYNCSARLAGNEILDGKCFTKNGGTIDVTGTFSN